MATTIDFPVGPGACAAILSIIRDAWVSPEASLDVRSGDGMDPDLAAALREEQEERFAEERALVERLLREAAFEKGPVTLPDEETELLLQAVAGIRLALRSGKLGFLSDEILESGGWQPTKLDPSVRAVLGAYLFWAALQETIIHALDKSIHSFLREEDEPEFE